MTKLLEMVMECGAQAFRCLSLKAWICEAGLSDLSSALPEKKKKKSLVLSSRGT